jgi:MFS family permease
MGIWIGSPGLGYVIAGIASFNIGHIYSATASWRLLYIIWGMITVAWGLISMIALLELPLTTRFPSEEERTLIVAKVRNNGTVLRMRHSSEHSSRKRWRISRHGCCFFLPSRVIRQMGG